MFDDDIPVPASSPRGRPTKYHFDQMKPGQSFALPKAEARRLSNAACAAAKKNGITLAVRACPVNPDTHVRCWRVA